MRYALLLIGSLIFLLETTVFASVDSSLAIKNIPTNLKTWEEIKAFVLGGVNNDKLVIKQSEQSLSINNEKDIYQVALYKGDVIQYSTLTIAQIGGDNRQFGRSIDRSFIPYLQYSQHLKEMHEFVQASGVNIKENETIGGVRSSLFYPEKGSPEIYLSHDFAKHPVFGVAHEMQHFLNRPLLLMLTERTLSSIGERRFSEMMFTFLDEYLAVSNEKVVAAELLEKFPHLASQEILDVKSMSDSECQRYVFEKWKSYYKWTPDFFEVIKKVSIDSKSLLNEIHTFQMKYGMQKDLPKALKSLAAAEQKMNPKLVDPAVIAAPDNSHLPWTYRPEAGLSFPIRTVWIPEADIELALNKEQLSEGLATEISRVIDGKKHFAYFIHPLSEVEYKDLIWKYSSSFEFVATPGSSNRTLLVRSIKSQQIFYVKTSLAVVIAGAKRTIPLGEVTRSVGHSKFLEKLAVSEPRLLFLPEPLGLIPKGMERGGQVIRLVDTNRLSNNLMPLFSFYSLENGVDVTGEIAAKNGISREILLSQKVISPLLSLLLDLKNNYGFAHEAHAQNILVEVNQEGMPTGRFVIKDLAGLNVDFSRYSDVYESLPVFRDKRKEYFQDETHLAFKQSIDSYFKAGFLYGVDKYLERTESSYRAGSVYLILTEPRQQKVILCGQLFAI